MVIVGVIGKTNVGKTTFFNAATLLNAKISTYPFATKIPNRGPAYVQTACVCREFNLKDNPLNSACIEGSRFIPIELIDVPGLIQGAHLGRGLGTRFLDVAMTSDTLLHIVDASGSINEEGKIVEPGKGDPLKDYYEIEKELTLWFKSFIKQRNKRVLRIMKAKKWDLPKALASILEGVRIGPDMVLTTLETNNLVEKPFDRWSDSDLEAFSSTLRQRAKPTLIVANKMDLPSAEKNYERMSEELGGRFVVPCSTDAELALRRAEKAGLVRYIPGEENFKIIDESRLSEKQRWALSYVSDNVFLKWLRTGIQFALNFAVFKLLRMNTIYPVLDEKKLADGHGNVLPDVHLMPRGSTTRDLAEKIHSDLARSYIYALDVRTGVRLPASYVMRDRDIIKIVAAKKKTSHRARR